MLKGINILKLLFVMKTNEEIKWFVFIFTETSSCEETSSFRKKQVLQKQVHSETSSHVKMTNYSFWIKRIKNPTPTKRSFIQLTFHL